MILKRFKTDILHYEYEKINEKNIKNFHLNENMTKLEILAHISKKWNNYLEKDFKTIQSLYSYSRNDLKTIYEKYIKTSNIKKIDETINEETDKETNDIIFENLLNETLLELNNRYGSNDAVQNIRIEENLIVFDLLCDTDIEKSVTEYNGIKLKYNKICNIDEHNKNDNDNDIDDDIDDEILIKQSIYLNEQFSKLF